MHPPTADRACLGRKAVVEPDRRRHWPCVERMIPLPPTVLPVEQTTLIVRQPVSLGFSSRRGEHLDEADAALKG